MENWKNQLADCLIKFHTSDCRGELGADSAANVWLEFNDVELFFSAADVYFYHDH